MFSSLPTDICFLFLPSYFHLQSHITKGGSGFRVSPDDEMIHWKKRSFSVLRGRVGHLWAGRRWKRRGGDEKHWITCLTMEMDYLGLSRYFRVTYQQCLGFWPKGERCSIRNERKERKKQLWWQPKEYIHKSSAGEHKVTSHPCHPLSSKLYNPRFRCVEK